jgi:hypothetical protein
MTSKGGKATKATEQVEAVTLLAAAAALGLRLARLRELVQRGALQVITRRRVAMVPETEVRRLQGHLRGWEAKSKQEVEIDQQLARVRAGMAKSPAKRRGTSTCLSLPAAAKELGLEMTQLRRLLGWQLLTFDVGFERVIPWCEIQRYKERTTVFRRTGRLPPPRSPWAPLPEEASDALRRRRSADGAAR